MRYTRPRRSRLSHSPRVMTLFAKPTLNNDRIHECALSLQSIEHRARATRYTRHACWSDNCAPHSEINDFIYARISHQAKTSCIVQRAKGNIYIYIHIERVRCIDWRYAQRTPYSYSATLSDSISANWYHFAYMHRSHHDDCARVQPTPTYIFKWTLSARLNERKNYRLFA